MNLPFAIADLKLIPVSSLQAGSLFYLVREAKLATLCMRSALGEVPMFATLDGESPFALHEVGRAARVCLRIPTNPLQIRIGQHQPGAPDQDKPGSLVIASDGPVVTVRLDGYAGSCQLYGMRLSNGALIQDGPDTHCCVENWQLVSRAENGSETVLLTVGDMA